ncbi:MAG: hypothetical protein QF805_27495, partial [Pirellulaceae bacterium]|nr:hypothetical protein [Pirellulaceae bacterium]
AVVKGPTSSLTAGVDLYGVTVERVEQLEFAAGVEPIVVLASESNAPVCTLIRTDDGERLVWHAPLEGAAPELRELAEEVAARAIDRFADFTPTIYRAHRLGEAIALPPGDGPVSVQAPDATGIDAPADASFVRPTGQVGEWRIGGAPTPVHLMAGVESEMDWTSIEDDQSLYTPRSRTALWQWFACLAILLQVVEWAMRKFGWTI